MRKNNKIKYKSKLDKMLTRYTIPMMMVLVFIVVFIGIIILVGYDFETSLFNIKRLLIVIPLTVALFGFLCTRIGCLWMKFIRSIEDDRIDKHHSSPDIMLDQIIEADIMSTNRPNKNKRIYPEETIKSALKEKINEEYYNAQSDLMPSSKEEVVNDDDVEKLSVNGIPISDDK